MATSKTFKLTPQQIMGGARDYAQTTRKTAKAMGAILQGWTQTAQEVTGPIGLAAPSAPTVYVCTVKSAAQVLLPPAGQSSFPLIFIRMDSGSLVLKIAPYGSDLIEGVSTPLMLSGRYSKLFLISDGVSQWFRLI